MTYPSQKIANNILLNTGSLESLGLSPITVGGGIFNTSRLWPTANLALFIPIQIAQTLVAVKMWVMNGATAAGNMDVGLYKEDGTRLVSSGTTAQAGTNTSQEFDITDTVLVGPGRYYMAIAMDGTAATTFAAAYGAGLAQASGVAQMSAAFTLPAPATLQACVTNYVPMMGISSRALVV